MSDHRAVGSEAGPSQAFERELALEQARVDDIYQLLDAKRASYRQAQTAAMSHRGTGTPQALIERDALTAHFGDFAAHLEQVEERLVFGRLDDAQGTVTYIGRVGLTAGDGITQALVDWRAQAARPFYQATQLNPMGQVRRRSLTTRLRQVLTLNDDVLDPDTAHRLGTIIHGQGALLAALGAARTGQMQDIVATIQAEQDRVIRHDAPELLVIQGGPGTGKTAVALHRAAYLLYTHRERLARSGVLVVGPSRRFLRYIEQVLPALGETGVVSTTFASIVPGLQATGSDSPAVADLKGSLDWVQICRAAVQSLQRIPSADQTFRIGSAQVTLTPADYRQAQSAAVERHEPHNQARETFARHLVGVAAKRLIEKTGEEDWDWAREQVRSNPDLRRAVNLAWLPYEADKLLRKLLADEALLERCAPQLTPAQRALLVRPRDAALTPADIVLIDEIAELLGPLPARRPVRQRVDEVARAGDAIESMDLDGAMVSAAELVKRAAGLETKQALNQVAAGARDWTYGHVVVDEAQEVSHMGWRLLLRRCPRRSFTIVGDLAQRSTLPPTASWASALGPAARALSAEVSLEVCYRTPAQIMDFAAEFCRAAGLDSLYPVRCARSVPGCIAQSSYPGGGAEAAVGQRRATAVAAAVAAELAHLDDLQGPGLGTLAVIAATESVRAELRAELGVAPASDPDSDRVQVLSPDQAKGLEFDTVVVVDHQDLAANPAAAYVALTRPTQRLHLVCGRL